MTPGAETTVELAAMQTALDALDPLDRDAQVRAVQWLAERLGTTAANARRMMPSPPAGHGPATQEARKRWLQEAWLADVPLADLASDLGLTTGGVNSMVSRMRREGWDLPHRTRRPHGAER